MSRTLSRLVYGLLSLLLAAGAAAQTPAVDDLWTSLAAHESASGSFAQRIYDEQGELLERSSGHYAILRPSYFRWEIDSPDRQLLLVAEDALWHYDIDLATATRRRSTEEGAFAPLQLLGGDVEAMRARFSVEVLGAEHYRLLPRWAQAGFASVELRWSEEQLRAMTVIDRSGQKLEIELAPELPVPALQPEDFTFEPPAGVDVYVEGSL